MPLRGETETLSAGPASRKRTYEQITRSQSRSVTPSPSAKRRRTIPSPPPLPNSPPMSEAESRDARPRRFVGDGLDFRIPTSLAMSQAQEDNTIDLTLEEDTPPPSPTQTYATGGPRAVQPPRIQANIPPHVVFRSSSRASTASQRTRLERSRRRPPPAPEQPIYLSSSDEEDEVDLEVRPGDGISEATPSSPEIQITGVRHLPNPDNRYLPPPNLNNRRTTPPELRRADAQTFSNAVRQIPENFLRSMGVGIPHPNNVPTGAVQAPAIGTGQWFEYARRMLGAPVPAAHVPAPLDPGIYDDGLEDYDNIALDYATQAFIIEDPAADEAPVPNDEYKPPSAAPVGLTRDIDEDGDVLICAGCDDELAAEGDDETKQQVWMAKKCGHVYCGACANSRNAYKSRNDRDRNRSKRQKTDGLKACRVDGCGEKLTNKSSMFQLYL